MSLNREALKKIVARVVGEKLDGVVEDDMASRRDETCEGPRPLITEADVMRARQEGRALYIPPRTILTPSAKDAIERYRVTIERNERPKGAGAAQGGPAPSAPRKAKVVLGADHGGYALKEALKAFLETEAGIPCEDVGCFGPESVDYPDFAAKVAEKVAGGDCCRGIIIDGAGIGSAMAANKIGGIRAAHCSNVVEARNAREHNDANVLTLGARVIGEDMARAVTAVFLKTDFAGGRHKRRVDKISSLEG